MNNQESEDEGQDQINKLLQNAALKNKNHSLIEEEYLDEEGQQIQNMKNKMKLQAQNRKRMPISVEKYSNHSSSPNKYQLMQIENKSIPKLKFYDLAQEIQFFLTEVFNYDNQLFITGIMKNGHTINIVAKNIRKTIYFCLKQENNNEQLSVEFKNKAQKQIKEKLAMSNIQIISHNFRQMKYVFEVKDIVRSRRPYYEVRYLFNAKSKNPPQPDWQGETFKYVIGTSYTPLEVFIIQTGIKGPSWVTVDKKMLEDNPKNIESGLCTEIEDPEFIRPLQKGILKPPPVRVMSISLKAVRPSQVSKKKLFISKNLEVMHIYCISYHFCSSYSIQAKPLNFKQSSKTYYLKSFGNFSNKKYQQWYSFNDEKQMIGRFKADLNSLDPDFIVCHDSSRIIDTLITRMQQINDRNEKPKLGRFVYFHESSKINPTQRINSALAGRMLVDTYLHCKDMIKSVDYELSDMVKNITPKIQFNNMNDEEALNFMNENKGEIIIAKVSEESKCVFALMNHLQVLQISCRLSNICGNIWKRSLENQRAQRNQYLIMHECFQRNLIIPDKFLKSRDDETKQQHKKGAYSGGMVLNPEKGLYMDYILLLDFNSLYPSIIREYNVCFSIIDRPRIPLSFYYKNKKDKSQKMQIQENENDQQNDQVNPPKPSECIRQKWGFLPCLIDKIVQRRKRCKKQLKNASAQRSIILDIQQKCYKLVANSIYGCLGFSASRFYSKPMAALITRMGREALIKAKDIVGIRGDVNVIYGDTDSLMIEPIKLNSENEIDKILQICKLAQQMKKKINKEYSMLQIDIDGIFKPLILLMKKKYVANKLTNFDRIISKIDTKPTFSLQYKGIQVVRRDGCELARKVLRTFIEQVISSSSNDKYDVYEKIYAYFEKIYGQMSQIDIKYFIFTKYLHKKPSEYKNEKSLPHVKVALELLKQNQKLQTLVNHSINYVVCTQPQNQGLAAKCYDIRTYQRSQNSSSNSEKLTIDFDHYIRQILISVGRITTHLHDFDSDRVLQAFKIDRIKRNKYKKIMQKETQGQDQNFNDFLKIESIEKGNNLNLQLGQYQCKNCQLSEPLIKKGVFRDRCSKCETKFSCQIVVSNRMTRLFKKKISKYYSNPWKCSCNKEHDIIPLTYCCRIKDEPKSRIPFELHQIIYNCKQICARIFEKNINYDTRNLQKLENKLNKFLQQSRFEDISHLLSKIKF